MKLGYKGATIRIYLPHEGRPLEVELSKFDKSGLLVRKEDNDLEIIITGDSAKIQTRSNNLIKPATLRYLHSDSNKNNITDYSPCFALEMGDNIYQFYRNGGIIVTYKEE